MGKLRIAAGISCILLAAGMAAFWGKEYYPVLMEYKESRDFYEDLEDQNKGDREPDRQQEVQDWVTSLGIDTAIKPQDVLDIDGDALRERNSDYLGWIYIPDTDVSYPVVMSHDNQDYLHQSLDKGYLYAGTIFMDCRCYDGITNRHSILYGHNMRDGSMFSGIKKFGDQEFAGEHPYFWFVTPEYRLLYQVFSATVCGPYDETVFGVTYRDTEEFQDAMEDIAGRSTVQFDTVPTKEDFVMTLSTCTDDSMSRFTLHGVLLGAMPE